MKDRGAVRGGMVLQWAVRPSLLLILVMGVAGGCARGHHEIEPLPLRDASMPDRWPLAQSEYRITSEFGEARSGGRIHNGMDIAAPKDTPVLATADGQVTFAGVFKGYGNLVVLFHREGLETAYGHLNSMAVRAGNSIQQGQVIGGVGCTGNATGPHLHYEVRAHGEAVDPRDFVP